MVKVGPMSTCANTNLADGVLFSGEAHVLSKDKRNGPTRRSGGK